MFDAEAVSAKNAIHEFMLCVYLSLKLLLITPNAIPN